VPAGGKGSAWRLLLSGIALVLASCSASGRHAPATAAATAPGQTLPDVTFQTAQNESIETDFKGRVVFVDFWATKCKGCDVMRAAAERLYKRAAADTWFMGINEDEEQQTWKDYMAHHFSALSEVWDKVHSFRRTRGMAGPPSALVVDRGGHVQWRCSRWTNATEAEVSVILDRLARQTQ
jgi:thiol-disulfide isomerase/thioredoxin